MVCFVRNPWRSAIFYQRQQRASILAFGASRLRCLDLKRRCLSLVPGAQEIEGAGRRVVLCYVHLQILHGSRNENFKTCPELAYRCRGEGEGRRGDRNSHPSPSRRIVSFDE